MPDTFLTERVMRIESDRYVCRVWTVYASDDDGGSAVRSAVTNALTYLETETMLDIETVMLDLAGFIVGINSVEITDKSSGAGLCTHKNWP